MDSSVPPSFPHTSENTTSCHVNYGGDLHKVEMQPETVYSKSTVVVVQQNTPPIRDDFLWSIFNTIYLNMCCLGFVALMYSVKSRDLKVFGDKSGAILFATKARKFNIAATAVSVTLFLIVIIINVTTRQT
ncbi:dispanin subfamily A member 2b-like [Phyllobates terribilis]|uniref:dispanin subfamily A member 2b-like n=1 Tax=Phyllobates terribilis TaxID=111132 RepID=UPI003CCB29E1